MPPFPDFLSDDSPFADFGATPEPTGKTKSKAQGKLKKKTDVSVEQPSKEKAVKGTKKASRYRVPSPPSVPPSPPAEVSDAVTSPVFAALADKAFSKTTGFDTDTWADSIPFGASPPSRPPQAFAEPTPAPSAVPSHPEELRGGFSKPSPTTSPRPAYRAPNRQSIGNQQAFGNYLATSPRGRPASMPAQYSPVPPLPHYPQPHFYGVREADLGLKSRSTSRKSSERGFESLDTIPPTVDDAATTGAPALLVSSDESLHIFRVEREGFHPVGQLQGLRGKVVTAKIIPTASRHDQLRQQRPLIAIVVHGPMSVASVMQEQNMDDSRHSEFDPSESTLLAMQAATGPSEPTDKFQTTVEVYSLKDRGHIATLYESPPIEMELRPGERYPEAPPPFGALNVQARGRFIIVTSATSGEVYIYEAVKDNPNLAFRCIGKTWTSMQTKKSRTWSTSSTSADTDLGHDGSQPVAPQTEVVLASLSNRWLATVPPTPSSKSTLHGKTKVTNLGKSPPGVKSHAPASQPPVSCELDTPLEESLLNKVGRDVTQAALSGARWVGGQGMQAWKNYWNKPSDTPAYDHGMSSPAHQQFPPTHANDETMRSSQSPTLISILDLEKLSEHQDAKAEAALSPIATFSLPEGCSYLSFNPTGLSLLTASTKGDLHYVWDLMRMVYGKSVILRSLESDGHTKPFVRQVARFTRVTTANIVDIVWAEPKGEKLAIVTDRGTVHIHDIPQAAFQWPPPPRAKRPSPPKTNSSENVPTSSAGGLGAAFNAVSGSAQPIFSAVRGSGLPTFGGFNIAAAGAGAGVTGSRIVSSGFSKSMGAATGTVNTIRHMGENRLQLPGSIGNVVLGSTRWANTKDSAIIVVVGGGVLRMHTILSNGDIKGRKRRQSVVSHRLAEINVPHVTAEDTGVSDNHVVLRGYWSETTVVQKPARISAQPISYAELETSAPYQPFHTDKRVNLHVYDHADHHLSSLEPWVFGEDIPTKQLVISGADDSDEAQLGPEASAPMENLIDTGGGEVAEEPVVTTTRRKRGKKFPTDDTESFEAGSVMVDFAADRV